jgi:hypothetical protein
MSGLVHQCQVLDLLLDVEEAPVLILTEMGVFIVAMDVN